MNEIKSKLKIKRKGKKKSEIIYIFPVEIYGSAEWNPPSVWEGTKK